jgi:peroxiredoxin
MKSLAVTVAALATCATFAVAAGAPLIPPNPRTATPIFPISVSAEYAVLEVGSSAPDFSFESPTGGSRRLHELRAQGAVLVVIGAGDQRLIRLESERPRLLAMGVVPVVVLDYKASHCRDIARRLGLQGVVAPDPQRVIAAQFNALERSTHASVPAWFVINREGRVRALGRLEWPSSAWTEVAAGALGVATAGGNVTTSHTAP